MVLGNKFQYNVLDIRSWKLEQAKLVTLFNKWTDIFQSFDSHNKFNVANICVVTTSYKNKLQQLQSTTQQAIEYWINEK
jgi:hypothetical protein